jgi:prepilin-type processing-associated H-X9-DG protein
MVELLVSMGVFVVLIALLLPSVSSVRENANRASCQQNLKNIGSGMIQYASENNGFYPPHWGEVPGTTLTWYGFIAPYINEWNGDLSKSMSKDFFCPSASNQYRTGQTYTSTAENGRGMSYGYNYYLLTQNYASQPVSRNLGVATPSKLVLVGDVPVVTSAEPAVRLPSYMGNYLMYPAEAVLSERHNKGCNLVFADGHVENRNTRRLVNPDEEFNLSNWDPR